MRVLCLLELFRKKDQIHFAWVVDEYHSPRGEVSFNDILESMAGAIPAQQAYPEPAAVQREDGSWLLDGFMLLKKVQIKLGIDRPMREKDQPFQMLAGFVRARCDNKPQAGKRFDWEGHRFEIVDMDGKRIDRNLVTPLPKNELPP